MRLLHGDCVEVMRGLPECSVDAIVTDPPYGLEFMGKEWDKLTRNQMLAKEGSREKERIEEYGNSYAGRRSKLPDLGAQTKYARESQAWHEEWAREALRVLKPGGHLLAFSATRTYHRMACAIEDAGFEIRDSIHWVYGSGFPKSLNIGKAIDKTNGKGDRRFEFTRWLTNVGLKPKFLNELTGTAMGHHWTTHPTQPAIPTAAMWAVIRPHCGEVPEWVDELVKRVEAEREIIATSNNGIAGGTGKHAGEDGKYGFGAEFNLTTAATDEARRWEGWGTALKPAHEPVVVARKPLVGTVAANVLEHGTGGLNIDGSRIGTEKSGWNGLTSDRTGSAWDASGLKGESVRQASSGRWPANVVFDRAAGEALDRQSGERQAGAFPKSANVATGKHYEGGWGPVNNGERRQMDSGGASRFFTQADFGPDDWPFVYQAKPSRRERNAGLDGLPETTVQTVAHGDRTYGTLPDGTPQEMHPKPRANHHPTVKPVALMRHLVRLVTPPGGVVLDPFAGSGTTLVAAILEGLDCIGIEMTDEYLPIIEGRTAWAVEQAAARGAEQATLL